MIGTPSLVDISESDIRNWYESDGEEWVADDEGVVFDTDFEDVDPFGVSFDSI